MTSIFEKIKDVISSNRYISMRVHGTSAHVQTEPPPDQPDKKIVKVERVPQGTLITANFPASMTIHFSIPTPLIIERTRSLFSFAQITTLRTSTPVFEGTSISAVRIQLYLKTCNGIFGELKIMDGDKVILNENMVNLNTLIPTNDEYNEEPLSQASFTIDINKRIYNALGVSFDANFSHAAFNSDNTEILLIGAKVIFNLKG
ncbi:hypothetical protein OH720_10990 [Pseudomonas sp. WJP1]|uniref:hypothetical protein n=1 Tax=Pseudomonas sp. WJP1 TaxID=2986947 RepID=UPI002349F824|nr:hypothetical protein [Pseudomonas sp. WJP1]WCM53506.1 hypothetical protein OH720_10990 [Pseudomonas sp. WJP1]